MATLNDPTLANPLNDQTPPETGGNPLTDQVQGPAPDDYLTNFDHNTIMTNPYFLSDARKYYEQRDGLPIWSDDDLRQKFFSDRTFKSANSVGIVGDWIGAAGQSSDMNTLEGRLQSVYQRFPNFWQDGGRGAGGLAENLAAMAVDPVNFIPLGEIAKVAQGVGIATRAAEAGGTALGSALKQGAAAALREGTVMGGIGAGYDALSQERDITLGLQPSFNWMQVAESAATMAAMGGVPAALGGALRGGVAAAGVIDKIRTWPEARGAEVAKLEGFKQSAEAASGAGNPDIASTMMAKAKAQQSIIDRMDQQYRNRGGTDDKLGIVHDTGPAPDESASSPAPDPEVEKTQQKLLDVAQLYHDELQDPHLDPNSAEGRVFARKQHDLQWAIHYDEKAADYGRIISDLQAKPKRTPKEMAQITAMQAELSQRGAMRDALIRSAPRTSADVDRVLDDPKLQVVQVAPDQAAASATPPAPAPAPAGEGGQMPAPAGAPAAGPAGPEAPPPAPAQAPPAATSTPGPAPAPTAGGGAGGGSAEAGAAAEAAPAPEIAAAAADTGAAPAEVAAETADQKRARLKGQKATKTEATFAPTEAWQPVPEGAVLPAGTETRLDQATGQHMARIAPHPLSEAPTATISEEAARLEHGLAELLSQVHDTKGYKYEGKTEAGKLSMTDALGQAGYDGEAITEITRQIKAQVKGVPAKQRANIQREMLGEALVAKQIEKVEVTLEAAGVEPSTDILKAVINDGVQDQRTAAIAMRILDGRSRLRFEPEEAPQGSIAEDFLSRLGDTSEPGDTLADQSGSGGLSSEQRRIFTSIARKEAEKKLDTLGLSDESKERFLGEASHFNELFLSSTYLPGSHEGRLGTYRNFLNELADRMQRQEAGKTSPSLRVFGERGASAGGEARFGNPENIYKKNLLRPDKRAGIPGILKSANQSGFIGRGLGKADIGTVGEARARAAMEKWRDVRALTLKERYATADGKDMKPGEVVYYNPITDKAYADPILAGRRRPDEPGAQPTGGQTVIPAVPSAREADIAKAAGIDPVEYATRLRDLDPKDITASGSVETEMGETLANGTRYVRTKDGGIYKNAAELRTFVADAMKAEPAPAPAAAPAPVVRAPANAISPQARNLAEGLKAAGVPVDDRLLAVIQAELERQGALKEGPIPPPVASEPGEASTYAGVPDNWTPPPGRKLSIRNIKTGSVRTLNPSQRTVDEMLAGKPRDGWEIGSNKTDISSGQQGAAREDFIRAGEEPPPITQADEVTAAPKVTDPGDMLNTEQARSTPLAEPITIRDRSYGAITVHTALEAADTLRALHTAPWPETRAGMEERLTTIRTLTKAAPTVKQPSVTRAAARQALTDIFTKLAPDQLHLALDALRRLPGVDLPDIAEMSSTFPGGRARGVFTGYGAKQATDLEGSLLPGGTVGLADPGAFNQSYPLITVFHHELGHWGYDNILNEEDRMGYMEWVHQNFYKSGKLDHGLIDSTATTRGATITPQEMFATHFQRWVASNGKSMAVPASLMQKFASYLGHFIKRWFGDSNEIDRAMEPLFAKIMPDPAADTWLKTLGSEGATAEGQALVNSTRVLDKARYNLEIGLTSSDPLLIEDGIRGAMRTINASAETLGRERTDAMVTRLADIIKADENVLRGYDPRLAAARSDYQARVGVSPELSWKDLSEGEQRVLRENFRNGDLVSIGSNVELDNGDWTITSFDGGDPRNPTFTLEQITENGVTAEQFTRNELSRMGAGHVVPQDQYDMTRLVWTEDPTLALVKSANEAHQILSEAFGEHEAAFNRVEGGKTSSLRVDNPTDLPAEPLGSTATFAVGNQLRIRDVIKLLENAKTTTDVMGVEHMIEAMDEIARVTGRTGINRKTGKATAAHGAVHFNVWRYLSTNIKKRGREIVEEAYGLFTDFNIQTEAEYARKAELAGASTDAETKAGEKGYAKNVTVTMGSMTEGQRARYDDLIDRALAAIPDIDKDLTRVRRWAEASTRKNIAKGTYVVGGKVANDVKKTQRIKNVAKAASTKRPRPQDEIKGLGATPDVSSFKGMSEVQLADAIIQHGARSKTGLQYGAELLQRDKTTPFLPHVKAADVPNDIMQADTATLGTKLKTAIEGGDKKTADQVRWEALRRAKKNAIRRGIIDTADADVVASINREMGQTMGTPDHVGVPEGAPAVVKEMLSRFTHRKADVQTSLRTAMYRLFNLGGITDIANREGITVGRLFRMAGREIPDHLDPGATAFDVRDPVFNEVRSAMRRLVGNFAEGKGDAGENISNMVEMVLRSGMIGDHEYGAIHDGYELTHDSIKGALEGSRVTPPARRPDAWFADHVAEYLMGERGTAELFKPDDGMAAPGFGDVVKEIKTTVERVKDATAYVVNGLMHDDMRKEFPALTDYGDVFEQPRADQLKTAPAPAGMGEQGMLNQHAMDNDAPRINAILLNAMALTDDTLETDHMPRASILLADAAEKGGAGPRTNKLIIAGTQGLRKIEALPEATRFNFGHLYKSGSDLMRDTYGFKWWGDKLNPVDGPGIYHKIQTRTAEYLSPILSAAHQMSDTPQRVANWMRHNKPWGEVAQPKSHANVVEGLRGMKSYSSLTREEKALHDMIRTKLNKAHADARAAGVQIGDAGPHYYPQVFNTEAILRNKPAAIAAFAKYLRDERLGSGTAPPLSQEEAMAKAADIVDGITDDGGVYMPPKAERRASKADSIDHQRMFKLNETLKDPKTGKVMIGPDGAPMMRYAEAYKMLRPFMDNNMESGLSRYFDAIGRRVVTTEELGTNSHAFFDYTHVMKGGQERATERAVHLLSTKKVIRHNYLDQRDDGGFEEATRSIEDYHPMSPVEADLAVRAAMQQMGDAQTAEDIAKGTQEFLLRMSDRGQTAVRRADAIANALADSRNMGGRMPGRDAFARADASYRVAMQKPVGSQSNIARKTGRLLRNFNSVTMLGWTTLSSMPDLVYPLLRSGNLGALVRAWGNYASDPVYRSAMRSAGASIEQLTHDRIGMLYGGSGSRFTKSFFNLNMLTHWDSFVRELGSSVAWESFKAEQKRAIQAGQGTRSWRLAEARLKRYGLDHYLTNGRTLDDPSLLNIDSGDRNLREGMVKFVNECVFTHTPDDIPLWAQTPLGKLAFQLKTFQLTMSRLALGKDGIVRQFFRAAGGDPTASMMPMAYMLTLGTGIGWSANALKDLAQGRGGKTEDQHALRERRLSDIAKKFGWNVNIHGPADAFLGNYLESFIMLGGFGYLSDLLYQAGQQADNGAWGYQRFLGSVLGPTADLPHLAWEGGVAAKDALTGASSPAKGRADERVFVGDMLRRVPIFGGMRSVTSHLTDAIAGAPTKKRTSSSPIFTPQPAGDDAGGAGVDYGSFGSGGG